MWKNANTHTYVYQVQMDQEPQYKRGCLNLIEEKMGNTLEHIETISWTEHQWLKL